MTVCLEHRGPDDVGAIYWGQNSGPPTARPIGESWTVALAHRRLAILDLTRAGHQPMRTADDRFVLIFNGEIYNYIELRAQLHKLGHNFRSQTDTEVLLAGYAEWGLDLLDKMIGMYAFAILDTVTCRVLLARDPFGMKPLFYAYVNGSLAFASELPALLELPGVSRVANAKVMFDFLRFGVAESPDSTAVLGIQRLPLGHFLQIDCFAPTLSIPVKFWNPSTERVDVSFEEAATMTRELLLESVALHIRSDVPVGVSLSGGVDSSAIVGLMRHVGGPTAEIHSVSYVARTPGIDEEVWMDDVNLFNQTIPHKITANRQGLEDDLPHLIRSQGEPFGSTRTYVQYLVFQEAARHGLTVMLDGQGADELFAGYTSYTANRLVSLIREREFCAAFELLRKTSREPNAEGRLRVLMRAIDTSASSSLLYEMLRSIMGEALIPQWLDRDWLAASEVRPERIPDRFSIKSLRQALQLSMEYSLPALLRYEDRSSMAFSVESRLPFLTTPIANFAAGLPESFLVSDDRPSKAVLRRAVEGLVPPTVIARRDKLGFDSPERDWMTSHSFFDRVLEKESAREVSILNLPRLRSDWSAVKLGKRGYHPRFWRCANLILWAECFDVRFESEADPCAAIH